MSLSHTRDLSYANKILYCCGVNEKKFSLNDTHFYISERSWKLYKCGPQDLDSSLLVSKLEKLSLGFFLSDFFYERIFQVPGFDG